jgi:uncharacterized repeat protein (TIGR03803 family)
MKSIRFPLPLIAALAITLTVSAPALAQTFTTLANFNVENGESPNGGSLVQATDGNFYGTAASGGNNDSGVVFRITPSGDLTDIYSFCSQPPGCSDGAQPVAIFLGSDGNFYGTTYSGGLYAGASAGTVFKLTATGKLTTLYSFCEKLDCPDGDHPSGLVQARGGNLYGTTTNGGPSDYGVFFEINSAGEFQVLHSFCSATNCADGAFPNLPVQGSDGDLYGTTVDGGDVGLGTVYKITTAGQFTTLHSFCTRAPNCADGAAPSGALVQASDGDFYGATSYGGAKGYGNVFKLNRAGELTTLHIFQDTDGALPFFALIQANDGNLYGTTLIGGAGNGGTMYKVTSAGEFTSLYSFCNTFSCVGIPPEVGIIPEYALTQATSGLLFGGTDVGGTHNVGTIFSYSLGLGPLVKTLPIAAKVNERVIILGNNLTGSTRITFNGTPATFTVESDTYITATVPAGATTGTVQVTTPTGTLNSNPVFQVLQ